MKLKKKIRYLSAIVTTLIIALTLCQSNVVLAKSHRSTKYHKISKIVSMKRIVRINNLKTIAVLDKLIDQSHQNDNADVNKTEEQPSNHSEESQSQHNDNSTENVESSAPQSQQKRMIKYQDNVMNIGPVFGTLDNTNDVLNLQRYIDADPESHVGAMINEPNINDGKGTYFAAHNRGAFTPLTDLQINSRLTVYDDDGQNADYVVKDSTIIHNGTNAPIANYNPKIDNFIDALSNHESIVIQYCIADDMILFYLEKD